MKLTLAFLPLAALLLLSGATEGRSEDYKKHLGKSATVQHHPEGRHDREKVEVEDAPPQGKTLEQFRAELQEYLDLEKENSDGLKDDALIAEDSEDLSSEKYSDDSTAKLEELEVDDHEEALKSMQDEGDDNDKSKLMGEVNVEEDDDSDKSESKQDEDFAIEMDDSDHPRISGASQDKSSMQWWRRRRRRRYCRCNNWKKAYNRERHYKNYYYRLYVKYLRYYRSYYRKYIAYYRYYHTCNRRYRLCRRKYHRLRQGYKSIVKSHAHLLRTCKYRG
jgi:hypothetical protein